MKTDTLFYHLFERFPGLFFELIEHPPEEAEAYRFSSIELKQIGFRIDGVFLPATAAPEQPIYFLEVQFQTARQFYARFFAEIFLYLYKTELPNDWKAVVVYPTRRIDTADTVRYEELLTSGRVQRIYLDEAMETPKHSLGLRVLALVIVPENEANTQARALIAEASRETVDTSQAKALVELIETIMVYKFPQKTRREIEAMLGLAELKQTKVYQEAKEEGKEEGKIEGKIESVPKLLALGLSMEQVAMALELSVEQIQQAAKKKSS